MKKTSILLLATTIALLGCAGEPLPLYDSVPDWRLTTSDAEPMRLEDLRGQVAIYDFIFTRCAATCPMMTARMGDIASKIRSQDVRFVSISVDPEWDTPEVLQEYRDAVTNDGRWIFLTGGREEIRAISVEGFKLAADPPEQSAESGPIVHSSKFILVDRGGVIRGYYDSLSRSSMDALVEDSKRLLRE